MNPLPRIADSEWHVMRVLWEDSPLRANEVVERLSDGLSWSPRTVKTMLNRLVKKKALGFSQEGRVYHYFPEVKEEDCARAERKSFLQRVYGGALTPMIAQLIEEEEFDATELAELRAVLEKGMRNRKGARDKKGMRNNRNIRNKKGRAKS